MLYNYERLNLLHGLICFDLMEFCSKNHLHVHGSIKKGTSEINVSEWNRRYSYTESWKAKKEKYLHMDRFIDAKKYHKKKWF